MIRSKTLWVVLISGGLGAGALQAVRAANAPLAKESAQRLDEDFPHMRAALHDLRAARESLTHAEPRFKGHRDKAIEHVDAAIHECEDALKEG
jgi:hypothetical protein